MYIYRNDGFTFNLEIDHEAKNRPSKDGAVPLLELRSCVIMSFTN